MNMVCRLWLAGARAEQSGFPSSHSTNSVSIALYFAQWLLEERESAGMMVVISGLTCKLVSIQRLFHADNSSPSGICIQCGRWESIHGNALAG